MPLVLAFGVALTFLFHTVGIQQRKGPALSSLIGIIVGTQVLFSYQEKFRYPSRNLMIAGVTAALFVALMVWLRVTDRIPVPD